MIKRCTDKKLISKILNHPKVYGWISDDLSEKPYIPSDSLYLTNNEKTGIVKIEHMNGVACQIHVATLPELWGKASNHIKDVLDWIFTNTRYMKIVAFIPVYNKFTIQLAIKSGMKKEGCIEKSFLKNWILQDQLIYGLTKENFKKGVLCQQQQE
jgi:RimJ/RimL family protein N-acetyltransferase